MKKGTAIFGGIGLGLLIGILIGLSTSSTVGLIIGALSSGLLVFLGFKGKDSVIQTLRVGTFGISCTIALLIGLYLRVNNAFAPSIKSEVNSWIEDSIYSLDEAKSFVAYSRLGILTEEFQVDSFQNRKLSQTTVLFGSEINISDCEKLIGYEDFPIENELKAFKRVGGIWEKIVVLIEKEIEPENQKKTLHLFRKCLCDE